MRLANFVVFLCLLQALPCFGQVDRELKNRIQRDFVGKDSLRSFAMPGYGPDGIEKTQGWAARSGAKVRSLIIQDGEAKVEAYVCDEEFRYWLRVRGTVLDLDLWYGPYIFSAIDALDRSYFQKREFSRHRLGQEVPKLHPAGLMRKTAYICRLHNHLLEEFNIPSQPPSQYTTTAFYCRPGGHYWVRREKYGAEEWYGPYQLPTKPQTALTVGITLDKYYYSQGEPVRIQVWVKNQSNRGIWLRVYSAAPGDYKIDGQYRWSRGKLQSRAFGRKFVPRHGKTVLLDYFHSPQDYFLSPGSHTVTGVVFTSNYGDLKSSPVSFSVRAGSSNQSVKALLDRALSYMNLRQYDRARSCLKQILEKDANNALAYYNLACVESISFNTDLALDYLESSFRLGFDDFPHVAKDPDLINIRNTPRYHYLVEYYSMQSSMVK